MINSIGLDFTTVSIFISIAVIAFWVDMKAHKSDQEITLASAVKWSVFWVLISVTFGAYLYWHHGSEAASLFFTGYALEKVLSVDNLFVIMAIMSWFSIPEGLRHRVLYWGIIGAVVFRGIFVAVGTQLVALGPWVEIIFGCIVGWTAIMMLRKGEQDEVEDYSQHIAYKLVYRMLPVLPSLVGHRFFVSSNTLEKENLQSAALTTHKTARWYATPLFLCLAVIELSDVMFAFDSVPAVIAISKDPFIVYSAMMFAILGLRSLFFVLDALKSSLKYLESSVIGLLFFIAGKLILGASDHLFGVGIIITPGFSLSVVLVVLFVGIVASLISSHSEKETAHRN